MSKGLFITATGTDIGKTYVTALIIKKLIDNGINAGYYKAALSDAEERNGILIPKDAEYVKKISGVRQNFDDMVSYTYKIAVSPHLAAKIEGNPLDIEKVKSDFSAVCSKFDYVTAEGSGGIVCPIRFDENVHIMLEDIITELKLPTLIIADAGLGTINSVILTIEYLKQRHIPVKGIILNNFDNKSIMHRDNKDMIEKLSDISVVGVIEHNADDINIDIELLKSLYDEVR